MPPAGVLTAPEIDTDSPTAKRQPVSNLDALGLNQESEVVMVSKTPPQEEKPTSTNFRDREKRRTLPPIREGNVSLEVPVSEDVHQSLAALAKLEGTSAQRYNSQILSDHVRRQPQERIELGKKLLAEATFKTPYRAKIKTLEDRVKLLEKQLRHSSTSSRS